MDKNEKLLKIRLKEFQKKGWPLYLPNLGTLKIDPTEFNELFANIFIEFAYWANLGEILDYAGEGATIIRTNGNPLRAMVKKYSHIRKWLDREGHLSDDGKSVELYRHVFTQEIGHWLEGRIRWFSDDSNDRILLESDVQSQVAEMTQALLYLAGKMRARKAFRLYGMEGFRRVYLDQLFDRHVEYFNVCNKMIHATKMREWFPNLSHLQPVWLREWENEVRPMLLEKLHNSDLSIISAFIEDGVPSFSVSHPVLDEYRKMIAELYEEYKNELNSYVIPYRMLVRESNVVSTLSRQEDWFVAQEKTGKIDPNYYACFIADDGVYPLEGFYELQNLIDSIAVEGITKNLAFELYRGMGGELTFLLTRKNDRIIYGIDDEENGLMKFEFFSNFLESLYDNSGQTLISVRDEYGQETECLAVWIDGESGRLCYRWMD